MRRGVCRHDSAVLRGWLRTYPRWKTIIRQEQERANTGYVLAKDARRNTTLTQKHSSFHQARSRCRCGDIKELWDERLNFNPIQLMGGVTENQYNPRNMRKLSSKGIFVPDTNGFNTGVLLLSSQRMKEINFARDTVLSANAKLYPQWKHPDKVDPSKFYNVDQDVFNTVMLAFPSLRYQLSVKWNIQGCASFNTTMKVNLKFPFNDTWFIVMLKPSSSRCNTCTH
mmetsp:Transcript_27421/g.59911  ORF Transcript_27421/g.59911 Transcript_27421/m.59911 type:complete len:226 (-) Transcript_27421:727-1404(-)